MAWEEFTRGKRAKPDVQEFERNLSDNIFTLHEELATGIYRHGPYHRFSICDPKPRVIHKSLVRDRLVHHAVHRALYPIFDWTFIADSFSCRVGKGTHRALNRFRDMAARVSRNHTRTCWVLKCDIRKFFASINHVALLEILSHRISDEKTLCLLSEIVGSFSTDGKKGIGLPLGNLTSQLFANIYMNEFDRFVKHRLKPEEYIRYADDFALMSDCRECLVFLVEPIREFLRGRLHIDLHPDKLFLKTVASGVDFLGWVHFPDHRVVRTATRRRMFRRLEEHPTEDTLASYIGLMRHGNAERLKTEAKHVHWIFGSSGFPPSRE